MAKCGLPTQVFSRVVGYHRPITNWNKGKQQEFRDRTPFNVAERLRNGDLPPPRNLEPLDRFHSGEQQKTTP